MPTNCKNRLSVVVVDSLFILTPFCVGFAFGPCFLCST